MDNSTFMLAAILLVAIGAVLSDWQQRRDYNAIVARIGDRRAADETKEN